MSHWYDTDSIHTMEPLSVKTYVFLVSGYVQGSQENLGFYRQFEKSRIIGKWRGIIGRIISAHSEVMSMMFRHLASFSHKDNVKCKCSVSFPCMGKSLVFADLGKIEGALLWPLPLKPWYKSWLNLYSYQWNWIQTKSQAQDKDQEFRHRDA